MNRTCPNCGYPLHRPNHPAVGLVRFCRRSCIALWHTAHGITDTHRDPMPLVSGGFADRRHS